MINRGGAGADGRLSASRRSERRARLHGEKSNSTFNSHSFSLSDKDFFLEPTVCNF
jgi:hypothetical protein